MSLVSINVHVRCVTGALSRDLVALKGAKVGHREAVGQAERLRDAPPAVDVLRDDVHVKLVCVGAAAVLLVSLEREVRLEEEADPLVPAPHAVRRTHAIL